MKRYIKLIPFVCLLVLLAPISLRTVSATPKNRYVEQAEIFLQKGDYRQIWIYQQPGKINSLLNFLRTTKPHGRVYAAEPVVDCHHYRITLSFSDNTQRTYYLQDYQYFCKNAPIWQRISRSHGQLLYPLLQLLPTDQ